MGQEFSALKALLLFFLPLHALSRGNETEEIYTLKERLLGLLLAFLLTNTPPTPDSPSNFPNGSGR